MRPCTAWECERCNTQHNKHGVWWRTSNLAMSSAHKKLESFSERKLAKQREELRERVARNQDAVCALVCPPGLSALSFLAWLDGQTCA